ncbi:hypothetical protein [Hyalangium versicolor]|uniref:hypothetical protein n=1 Tax=Hyalangium versicolor TaxID=2861190 RepID=UPI001CCC4B6E|nr:hypothetical protein [Hyalangium versicolor]
MRSLPLLLILATTTALSSPASEEWVQRGRLGELRVGEIATAAKGKPDDGESMQMKIEAAFGLHARRPDLVQYPTSPDGLEVFHLVIEGATPKEECTIGFVYKNGVFSTFRIESLPTGWVVTLAPGKDEIEPIMRQRYAAVYKDRRTSPRPVLIHAGEQILVFDLAAPLRPFALDYELSRLRRLESTKAPQGIRP